MIFDKYYKVLQSYVNQEIISYRAGGWCIQPFKDIQESMKRNKLNIESSVFLGGKNTKQPYYYDFTKVPAKDHWRFSDDVCVENDQGVFTQFPISSQVYHPLFFWRLFILGRLKPSKHKPIGNGFPAKGGGSKKDFLLKKNLLCVSADGYFVTQIEKSINDFSGEEYGWWTYTISSGYDDYIVEEVLDSKGNRLYSETEEGFWDKMEYDDNGNITYREDSNGKWVV